MRELYPTQKMLNTFPTFVGKSFCKKCKQILPKEQRTETKRFFLVRENKGKMTIAVMVEGQKTVRYFHRDFFTNGEYKREEPIKILV